LGGSFAEAATEPSTFPVLLVHGVSWEIDEEDRSFGRLRYDSSGAARWTGMIGYLHARGISCGGTIRAEGGPIRLPEHLDTAGVDVEPGAGKLFVLKFSKAANTDGLGYKAIELADSIRQLCEFTGSEKVRIVAHSAGGMVARAYLQNALPGVEYRGDVDRLITVATPHLGSSVADHWGDYLGTRATSIRPDAALVWNLNQRLDLPADVTFASIVVRGIGADARGQGKDFDHLVDRALLKRLPVEYRVGGDQVIHVRSQNLRLARCGWRYEEETGRPIQYVLARVPDPTPQDGYFSDLTDARVHASAPFDATVQHLVFGLLKDRAVLWKESSERKLAEWCDWQARIHAAGAIESAALAIHPMSQVGSVRVEEFARVDSPGDMRTYHFAGRVWSQNMAVGLRRRWTRVSGTLELAFDAFGRVVDSSTIIEQREDE
jgi:pimeloyl-ACP methyl ester carboxylesterase